MPKKAKAKIESLHDAVEHFDEALVWLDAAKFGISVARGHLEAFRAYMLKLGKEHRAKAN